MSIITELTSTNAVAMSVATAFEHVIGGDVILGVGRPKIAAPTLEHLPSGPLRIAHMESTSGYKGALYLVVTEELGLQLERLAADEEMMTALMPVLTSATDALQQSAAQDMTFAPADEIAVEDLVGQVIADAEYALYSFIDGTERIATFVIAVGAAMSAADDDAPTSNGSVAVRGAAPARATAARPQAGPDSVSRHEFQNLSEGMIDLAEPRSLALLHDVEMGVTAELGRRRMTVRDLLSLTPGAVIELDRAAGSPVDVLVNGHLIARGEVVVIDEEFGIRIAEIVVGADATI
jgi:flagellar motor switch protein FliN